MILLSYGVGIIHAKSSKLYTCLYSCNTPWLICIRNCSPKSSCPHRSLNKTIYNRLGEQQDISQNGVQGSPWFEHLKSGSILCLRNIRIVWLICSILHIHLPSDKLSVLGQCFKGLESVGKKRIMRVNLCISIK